MSENKKNIPCHAGGEKHTFGSDLYNRKEKKVKICMNCKLEKEAGILDKMTAR